MKLGCAKFVGLLLFSMGVCAQELQPPVVIDGGFAPGKGGKPNGWGFSCKAEGAQCEIVPVPGVPGQTAAHIRVPGIRGLKPTWWFGNHKFIPFKPGQAYIISYRVKASCETMLKLRVEGWKGKKRVIRSMCEIRSFGPHQDWTLVEQNFLCPNSIEETRLSFIGTAGADLLIDDVQIRLGKLPPKPAPVPYEGSLKARVREKMDRGMVAVPCADGVYIGWRLLADDAADIAFNLYRAGGADAKRVRLNRDPLRQTTDFVDAAVKDASAASYVLCELRDGKESEVATCRVEPCTKGVGAYRAIPLQDVKSIDRLGIADLDGDGRYDFVVKHPLGHVRLVDDYESKAFGGWSASKTTYKIEAYKADGTRLWKNDLGWGIEHRNWFSPMIVHDLDGDGCAEVAVKIGEGDPRNEHGRVESGPEWVMVWDGRTGKELARAPWPSRGGFWNYNFTSRNQLAIAYLDGKTPCLLALRGTYGLMKVDAYEFRNRELKHLWSYSNADKPREYWGQGCHFTQAVDVDGDGRDEIFLGSTVLDDTGVPLWTTGKGHVDGMNTGDIDPRRPGLEVFYVVETRNQTGGLSLVDAATGEFIWKVETPTSHCHCAGICADLDPRYPGRECYGADKRKDKETGKEKIVARWFRTVDGTDLPVPQGWGFLVPTVYWDADLQKEYMKGGKIRKFGDTEGWPAPRMVSEPMDILGDWREEILELRDDELRIHVSTIPAMDRRVCLMQDPIYRLDTAMNAQAYPQRAMLSYDPVALSPNLNVTFAKDADATVARVVVSAPLQHGVEGVCKLSADGVRIVPDQFPVKLGAGQIVEQTLKLECDDFTTDAAPVRLTACLDAGADSLVVRRRLGAPPTPRLSLVKHPHCEAENFAEQSGGDVHLRTKEEKSGISGRCFSHWSKEGHTLAWKITVPKAGSYRPMFRYCTVASATRTLTIDGKPCASQTFPSSGGFGTHAEDWRIRGAATSGGTPLLLKLSAGVHTLRMAVPKTDRGLNLDIIALVPAGE